MKILVTHLFPHRDDVAGESEMQAWAWDVQTNSRSSSTFIVPHKRDKKGGPERLTDLRDIYENNANMGARRLREAIFSILPPWFTEEAKERCARTIEHGGGRPLPERIEGAVRTFERIGVTVDRLEQKLGRDRDRWTQYDIAQLIVTHRSIERGEVTIEDEFPPRRVTVDEITAPTAPTAPEPPAAAATAEPVDAQEPAAEPEPEPVAEPEPAPAQDATPGPMAATKQLNKLAAEFNRLGWTDEQIDAVVDRLCDLAATQRERVVAEVRVAAPLDPEQEQRLGAALARLKGRTVRLNVAVDPSVIGGVYVKVGDEVIDGTVASRLEQARRVVLG